MLSVLLSILLQVLWLYYFFFLCVASSHAGQFHEPGATAVAPRAKCQGTGKTVSPPRTWSCSIQLPAAARSLPSNSKSNTDAYRHNSPCVNLKVVQNDPFQSNKSIQSASLQRALASLPPDTRVRGKKVWARHRVNGAEMTGTAGSNTWRHFCIPAHHQTVPMRCLCCARSNEPPATSSASELLPPNDV